MEFPMSDTSLCFGQVFRARAKKPLDLLFGSTHEQKSQAHKSDLTNDNFYISYETSSREGMRPANLPSPARWSKDEALKAKKGN